MEKKQLEKHEITIFDQYFFSQGTHYEIYKILGAHLKENGVSFAVWAPNAKSVSVVGDFNEWDRSVHVMERLCPLGIFHLFIEGVSENTRYQYSVEAADGTLIRKSDPFANYADLRPGTASKVTDLSKIVWSDDAWMRKREEKLLMNRPISVYEVHIGSWKRHEERENVFYNYREFAIEMTAYLKDMGYTHVELMGIAEHPLDGSWGYQVTGYYAPTSRYGTPQDFAWMINYFHENEIAVILDWVPAHFPKDEQGLVCFDGAPLYEYEDPEKADHPHWGTKIFNFRKKEVQNFLIANALYWVEQFHVDGLRVDAVASMIYQDYGKDSGEWQPERNEKNNPEAISFLRRLNTMMHLRNPGTLMIAEESTAWPGVTGDVNEDGLGFDMKWNMGWMHDTIEYMQEAPQFRNKIHHKITFSMMYAFSEHFMLPFSHDEVVHMKGSMIEKMYGEKENRWRSLKAVYGFMIGHVGAKLLFMGQDFAQEREWSENRALDWELLDKDEHRQMQNWVRDLLHLYKDKKALYEVDHCWDGFEWINADDSKRSIYSFARHSKEKRNNLLFVCNFAPVARPDYRVGVDGENIYRLLLDSNSKKYGGEGTDRPAEYMPEKVSCDNRPFSFVYSLPAYGVAIFEF
ncbi:MAG: 1,4-alpha-glucan branching protein GlgB [Eubacteriales bacterium]|nr:1,4-alpha-glucan branching protein GlgB [Eubacteriales bacterium]